MLSNMRHDRQTCLLAVGKESVAAGLSVCASFSVTTVINRSVAYTGLRS